jgi:hypothetical protein
MIRLISRAVVVVVVLGSSAGVARAQYTEVQQQVIDRLTDSGYGQDCTNWLHTFCKCRMVTVEKVGGVKNAKDGKEIPGAFSVVTRYQWEDLLGKQGHTDLVLFFDANDRFLSFNNGETSAILLKHFDEARILLGVAKQLGKNGLKNLPDGLTRRLMEVLLDAVTVEDAYRTKMQMDFPGVAR